MSSASNPLNPTSTALSFLFEKTEDGSPTVRIHSDEGLSEAMHSLKGAFSETVYIYGTALETCLQRGFTPRILSLGLGLGYVEMLAAALILRASRTSLTTTTEDQQTCALVNEAGGESHELIRELRDWFTSWLTDTGSRPPEFSAAYDEILDRTSRETGIPAKEIKSFLAKMMREGRWRIREALDPKTTFETRFGCICFDAFSSKTSPELWTEPFLMEFLARSSAPGCVLSTYACTGALKRALKTSGFALTIREGFSSKRDSTFAVRAGPENPDS